MQSNIVMPQGRSNLTAFAAITGGLLYGSRWIWELSVGIVKNKNYGPSLVSQNFFLVKLLFILVLIGLYRQLENRKARSGFLLSITGLCWMALTRTIEAYGASSPWGFYSMPGLLLHMTGLLYAGYHTRKHGTRLGISLLCIGMLYLFGSLSAMLFFNLLGRDDFANQVASVIANCLLVAEAIGWILLGRWISRPKKGMAFYG